MALTVLQDSLVCSVYFAPRGKKRLLILGHQIAQRYLSPLDLLIGFVGDAGAGKSLLIKGMFPGLELTNDDDGVNIRPLPLLEGTDNTFFNSHTYHIDIRFESAFTQMHVLAEAITKAVQNGKRVIVEHFDLIYPFLKINAEILIGIGEEVFVTRPSIFGPIPKDVADIVFESLKYRKMAHTAEDMTSYILEHEYGMPLAESHSDVIHGFVLEFEEQPKVDIGDLEKRVQELIAQNVEISYHDERSILIDGHLHPCTGSRIHVTNANQIENFQLVHEYKYNPITQLYSLVGIIGSKQPEDTNDLNQLTKIKMLKGK